jgi:hypothetical protein
LTWQLLVAWWRAYDFFELNILVGDYVMPQVIAMRLRSTKQQSRESATPRLKPYAQKCCADTPY